jgi:hypothetical protein
VNLTSALSTSAWSHLACVIDGTSARLYVNGVLAGENAAFNYDSALAGQFSDNYLGRSQYSGDEYYDGGIDDFQIYNYALSGDEVSDIYRGEEPRRDLEFSSTLSLTAQWQAEVHNPGYFDHESVTVIVAYYNADGRLIYVLTKSGTVAGLGSLTLNEYAPQGAASAKAFFWDTASYVPLTA